MRTVAVAIIRNATTQWEEQFSVESEETAKSEVQEMVDYYNSTMRPGEMERTFVEIKRFEYPKDEPQSPIFYDDDEEDEDYFDHDDESF